MKFENKRTLLNIYTWNLFSEVQQMLNVMDMAVQFLKLHRTCNVYCIESYKDVNEQVHNSLLSSTRANPSIQPLIK